MRIDRRMVGVAATSAVLLCGAAAWATPALADEVTTSIEVLSTIGGTDQAPTTTIDPGADGTETSIVLIPATSSWVEPVAVAGTSSSAVEPPAVAPGAPESTTVEPTFVEQTLSTGTTEVGPQGETIVLGPAVRGTLVPVAPEQAVAVAADEPVVVQTLSTGTSTVLPDGTTLAVGPAVRASSVPRDQVSDRDNAVLDAGVVETGTDGPSPDEGVADAPVTQAKTSVAVQVLGTSMSSQSAASAIAVSSSAVHLTTAPATSTSMAGPVVDEVRVANAAGSVSAGSPVGIVLAAAAVIAVLGGALVVVRRRILPGHS